MTATIVVLTVVIVALVLLTTVRDLSLVTEGVPPTPVKAQLRSQGNRTKHRRSAGQVLRAVAAGLAAAAISLPVGVVVGLFLVLATLAWLG